MHLLPSVTILTRVVKEFLGALLSLCSYEGCADASELGVNLMASIAKGHAITMVRECSYHECPCLQTKRISGQCRPKQGRVQATHIGADKRALPAEG